ncbi:MAG: T9SS type A sorting domain-containing protein [Ignavibacteriaceae bacterium]
MYNINFNNFCCITALIVISFFIQDKCEAQQWIKANGPYYTSFHPNEISALACNGTRLYAGIAPEYFPFDSGGVYVSTDFGESWFDDNTNLIDRKFNHLTGVASLGVMGNIVFAGAYYGGVFISTDEGKSWAQSDSGMTSNQYSEENSEKVVGFAVTGSKVFALSAYNGVYLSTDSGKVWTPADSGLPVYPFFSEDNFTAITTNGSDIFVGTWNGIYKSSNSGSSWTMLNTNFGEDTTVNALIAAGSNIFAGTSDGFFINHNLFLSTDDGASWNEMNNGLDLRFLASSFATDGNNVFFSEQGYIYLFDKSTSTWKPEGSLGFPIQVCGSYLFSGSIGTGVWKLDLADITSVAGQNQGEVPASYSLEQNYPNPFNPSTVISYTLPAGGLVSLKVYDLLGEEVGTLVNRYQNAGLHEITFNASGLASGMYIYRLSAGNFVAEKKLVLMK